MPAGEHAHILETFRDLPENHRAFLTRWERCEADIECYLSTLAALDLIGENH